MALITLQESATFLTTSLGTDFVSHAYTALDGLSTQLAASAAAIAASSSSSSAFSALTSSQGAAGSALTVSSAPLLSSSSPSSSADNIAALMTPTGEQFRALLLATLTTCVLTSVSIHPQQLDVVARLTKLLWSIVFRPGVVQDRVVRAQATHCLREIEACFPGMLASSTASILRTFEQERTHARASLASLYLTVVLNHWYASASDSGADHEAAAAHVEESRLARPPESGFVSTPMETVRLGRRSEFQPADRSVEANESLLQDFRRALPMLLEQCPDFPAHVQSLVLLALTDGMQRASVPTDALRARFFRLVTSRSPLLVHAAFALRTRFPRALAESTIDRELTMRLVRAVGDPLLRIEERLLYCRWLASLQHAFPALSTQRSVFLKGKVLVRDPQSRVVDSQVSTAYADYVMLFPGPFDPPSIVEGRLNALARSFVPIGRGDMLAKSAAVPAPQCLRDCAMAFAGYESGSVRSWRVMGLMRITYAYASQFVRSLFDSAHATLLDLVLRHPHFCEPILALVKTRSPLSSSDVNMFSSLLPSIVNQLVDLSMPKFRAQMYHYLRILEVAADTPDLSPAGSHSNEHVPIRMHAHGVQESFVFCMLSLGGSRRTTFVIGSLGTVFWPFAAQPSACTPLRIRA
jgi:hypothetical protein